MKYESYPTFKFTHDFESRLLESQRVINKHPDRIPIICEKNRRSNVGEIDKIKYLVPRDLTCGQFIYVIKKRIQMHYENALFITISGIMPQTNTPIIDLYERYKDEDGFLYIMYSSENVFG